MNEKLPFSEDDNVDHPVSLYAATKKSNELLAHTYSHLYGLSTTGLRFFTVYGPWGRPDMAYYSFTKAILSNKTIKVFNNGHMLRDFTYIDDIVESVTRLVDVPATSSSDWNSSSPVPSKSSAPYKVYNIGNNNPVKLGKFIETLEGCLGMDAIKEYLPMQMGDVKATYADIASLEDVVDFKPSTSLRDGLDKFTSWYLEYTKS
jgi:UDP-glucuronate 4-epimerase